LGGKILDTWTDPKASLLKKTAATFGSLVVLPLALASFAISKVLNPLQTVKNSAGLIKFSFSRNSIALKAIFLITLVPAMAILSPFAAVQYGIKKAIIDPIRSSTKMSNKTYARLEKEIKEEQFDTLTDEEKQKSIDFQVENLKQDEALKAEIKDLTVEIEANPKEAISQFKAELKKNPERIPIFTPQCSEKVAKYMNQHPEKKANYDEMVKERAIRINNAVKHFKEERKKFNKPIMNPKT
jgi:hypothetical protein